MSNRCARLLPAGGAAVLVTALGVPTALAAGSWTDRPGGDVQAVSGRFTVTDSKTGAGIPCSSSTGSGTLKSGSGLSGADAGSLSAVSFVDCGGPLVFHLQAGGLLWHVNLSSYNAAKGVVRGTISHIRMPGSGPFTGGCTFLIDGTSATGSDGRVTFRYTDSTGHLNVLTTLGNLHFYDVRHGCLGLINSGDPAALSATYTVSPKQAITSP